MDNKLPSDFTQGSSAIGTFTETLIGAPLSFETFVHRHHTFDIPQFSNPPSVRVYTMAVAHHKQPFDEPDHVLKNA